VIDDQRRLSFGAVAELYDRARPSYPAELVDGLIALAGGLPLRAVEVGAGTGKATTLFAARGVAVDALEPSEGMASLARRHLAGDREVTVTVTEFESWERPGEPYGMLFSAQAWHWIDPARRCALARAAVAPGGVLSAFWNRPQWQECELREQLDGVYRMHAPQLALGSPMRPIVVARGSGVSDAWNAEVEATEGLEQPEFRVYPWMSEYTAEEYTELLRTHSDHGALAADAREALLAGIRDVIEAAGGVLRLPQRTDVCLARAV
jgi:SAM-dependent methyltransferase